MLDNFDRYIDDYNNNKISIKILLNPLFRIKITHFLGSIALIVSALLFTENLIAILIQFAVAIIIFFHDLDDKYLKINLQF